MKSFQEDISSINKIWIEYPGKYNPSKYLHDKTSFDTFIDYTTTSGLRGGIGIEVKYTEVGYKIGKKEKDEYGKARSSLYKGDKGQWVLS